jgi:tellurite resistance protein TerC
MTAPVGSGAEWAGFLALIAALLALDLGVFQRREPRPGLAEPLLWSGAWTALALVFDLWLGFHFGRRIGLEFLAGYLVERSLSFDNLFVFLLLFDYFAVPRAQQRRVLSWGIAGALAARGLFIAAGAALLQRWGWLLPLFGLFLIYAGARMTRRGAVRVEPRHNPVFKLFQRFVPMTAGYRDRSFLVREAGRTLATPLLLVLLVVEATDVAFAVDSLPAVFGVTRHAFIVFSSNAFAILGLRALYLVAADLMARLRWLPKGLGLVLAFVGAKMALEPWVAIPIEIALAVVALVLGIAVAASLYNGGGSHPRQTEGDAG